MDQANRQKLTLPELGWQPFFEDQVTVEEHESCALARVFARHRNHLVFGTPAGEITVEFSLIGNNADSGELDVCVGDWFVLDKATNRALRRLERKTHIARRAPGKEVKLQAIAANVDTAWIVCSCNQDFNLSRIERYLTLVKESGCQPVVVLTKADLIADAAGFRQEVERLQSGLIVENVDARDPEQVKVLDYWCGPGKTVSLLGSSGVGKSTLVNALGGGREKTGEIRKADDKGRHTTTHRSMHRMPTGGWLLDNPGMRELQLSGADETVDELFGDVVNISKNCKFRNCEHGGEPGCAIQKAIDDGVLEERRFKSYQKLQAEQLRNAATLAELREKGRKQGAFYKQVIEGKKKMREL